MKQIDVHFSTGNAQKTFPVTYAVENHEEECMQIFRCTVGLPQTQLPSWLNCGQFKLVTHVRDGLHLVDYNASWNGQPTTTEAESFRYKVYAEIYFNEMRRRHEALAHC